MKRKLYCKRGEVGIANIVPFAILFIIAGLVLGAGSLVLSKFADQVQTTSDTDITNFTIVAFSLNDSSPWYAPERSTYNEGNFAGDGRFVSMSNVVITNGSATEWEYIVEAANYTASTNGSVIFTALYSFNLSAGEISYTYTINDNPAAHIATTNSSEGLMQLSSFLPVIGIIIAIVIIIGLVINSLGGIRK